MGSMTKNMCFGGKQTSEQALFLPLTMLIWIYLTSLSLSFLILANDNA